MRGVPTHSHHPPCARTWLALGEFFQVLANSSPGPAPDSYRRGRRLGPVLVVAVPSRRPGNEDDETTGTTMALTEPEARVLGALRISSVESALTVRELSRETGLPETSIRRALLRLVRTGLAVATVQGPARWRSTDRGRLTICRAGYQEYTGVPR
ncbi:helix-turn-helix domain-containing protein [Nocardia sp. NPDC101769]|uniref:helix-turn-helix domain-containing protein n=1 Tax=Nocardia sp. NPDC101769 TaxID=3364333 RepID=UPI0037FE6631